MSAIKDVLGNSRVWRQPSVGRMCLAALVLGVAVLPWPSAAGAESDAASAKHRKWPFQLNLTGKAGQSARSISRADLVMPILQGQNDMLFGDVRGVYDDHESLEGNFGGGYRHIFRSASDPTKGIIVGAYAFFDRRRSRNDFHYSQRTFGLEVLHSYFELRGNIYRVEHESNTISTRSAAGTALSGTTIVSSKTERPLGGWDVEAGAGLPIAKKSKLWGYAGYFRFDADGTPRVDGPRFRVQYEWDEPFGWGASTLYLGGETRHDTTRGWDVSLVATLSIPLGIPFKANKDKRTFAGIDGRMTRPIVRDVDIFTFTSGYGDNKIVHNSTTPPGEILPPPGDGYPPYQGGGT